MSFMLMKSVFNILDTAWRAALATRIYLPGGEKEPPMMRSFRILCGASPVRAYARSDADPSEIVIVRRSAVKAARAGGHVDELVGGIIDFVNIMLDDGLYRPEQLVPTAVQAYCADFYRSVVGTNGHAVFIGRCGDNADYFWPNALIGLKAAGADAQAAVLEQMIAWAEANPHGLEDLKKRNDFDGADQLEELDQAFEIADEDLPLVGLLTRWIVGWPELRAIKDADYLQAMEHLASMNPDRNDMRAAQRIASFRHQIDDWLHVSIGMAATAVPEAEVRLGVHAGGLVRTVDGERLMVWGVHTSKGRRFAHVTEEGAWLYRRIEDGGRPAPEADNIAAAMAIMREMPNMKTPPRVGACLSHVKAGQIREVVEVANQVDAATAVDLLLRRIGHEEEIMSLSAVGLFRDEAGVDSVKWIVAAGNEPVFAVTHENGAELSRPGEAEAAVSVSADEVARHAETFGRHR
jgi:hypothetical protein